MKAFLPTTLSPLLRRVPSTFARASVARGLSTAPKKKEEPLPKSAYAEGHLRTDQLEYLDREIEQAVLLIENNMLDLKATYQEKRKHLENQNHDAMHPLLDRAAQQKEEISSNLEQLKTLLKQSRKAQTANFAVDAPDGEADGHLEEEMQEVEHILDDHCKPHYLKFKEYAVDAPDGESDDIQQVQTKDVLDQISEMGATENKESIVRQHATEDQVKKERARDPEHDW